MPADPLTHHGLYGLRSSAIPVLTATTGACQWEMAIFDSPQNRQPSTDHQKFVTDDYLGDPYSCAKSVHGRFWASG